MLTTANSQYYPFLDISMITQRCLSIIAFVSSELFIGIVLCQKTTTKLKHRRQKRWDFNGWMSKKRVEIVIEYLFYFNTRITVYVSLIFLLFHSNWKFKWDLVSVMIMPTKIKESSSFSCVSLVLICMKYRKGNLVLNQDNIIWQ